MPHGRSELLSRRRWIRLVAAASAAAPAMDALQVQAQGGSGATAALTNQAAPPRGTQLVLLGTQGGPNVNLRRAQAGNAVVVDGRPYVIDCGYGTVRSLVAAGLGYAQVGHVFITHLHDDHTSDIPALLSLQWTNGKRESTGIYGPYGTKAMTDAAIAFARANTEIRVIDEGRQVRPEALFRGHDVAASASPVEVFKDERVRVTAVENTHFPSEATAKMPYRSLAYRVDTASRSIVISGDTPYSKNLVALASGADLFVCETIDTTIHAGMLEQARAATAAGNANSVAKHVAETHTPSREVGRMAAEARVKTVVLTHLLPGSNRAAVAEFPDTAYIDDVRKEFGGQVIVGRDLMVL